jgi:hypothetical protein
VGWGMSLIVLVAAVTALGCSDQKNAMAPTSATSAIATSSAEQGVSWRWIDATHIEKTYYLAGRDIHGTHVTIGPLKVVYVCDYPVGYYGPPAPGHCYSDGSGCVDP